MIIAFNLFFRDWINILGLGGITTSIVSYMKDFTEGAFVGIIFVILAVIKTIFELNNKRKEGKLLDAKIRTEESKNYHLKNKIDEEEK